MNKMPISRYKKLSFKVLAILLPIFFLAIIELSLRLFGYGDNLKLFVQNPMEGYENYLIVNPIVGKKYFQKFEYTEPANDTFLKKKKEGSFRIFVMGSSTVYGFPYDRNLMFSRILHQRLSERYPDTHIEMVNTAITAINSFTLLDYVDQILDYEPDAILFYEGQNEFYGAFGVGSNETMSRFRWLTNLHLKMMDIRLYQVMRNTISAVTSSLNKGKNQKHGTLMKRIVGDSDILLRSKKYNLAMNRWQQNMGELLEKASKKNVPVFLSEVVSNIKDIEPFNSVAYDTLPMAIEVFNEARAAEANGDYAKAKTLYKRAKDLDCIRFRASEDVNLIIHKLANEHQVHLIPMVEYFERESEHGLIGDNLMTEHVHPNIEGYFLMARAFYDEIEKSEMIKSETKNELLGWESFQRNYGYTDLDSLVAVNRVAMLKTNWPFEKKENDGREYFRTHKPKNGLDTDAFNIVKDPKLSIGTVRLKLAEAYYEHDMFEKAYLEYEAVLRSNPYIAINYRDAAKCLVKLSDLPKAIEYYTKSLEFETNYFAYFKLGELYLLKSDYKKAIENFQIAYPLAPQSQRLPILTKSFVAMVYNGDKSGAKLIADELKKIDPKVNLVLPAKSYLYTQYIPYKTRTDVELALKLMEQKKFDQALEILMNAQKKYDSHITNRYIGENLANIGDLTNASKYYEKVYSEFKFDPIFLKQAIVLYIGLANQNRANEIYNELALLDPLDPELENLSMLILRINI